MQQISQTEGGGMIELNISLIIQLVNFLVLLAILNLVFYRPIRRIIKHRQDKMSDELTEIENFNEKAQLKLKDYEEALRKAREEGAEIRDSYKQDAVKEEQNIIAEANKKAAQDLDAARKEIVDQSEEAKKKLKKQVEKYAKLVADRIIVRA